MATNDQIADLLDHCAAHFRRAGTGAAVHQDPADPDVFRVRWHDIDGLMHAAMFRRTDLEAAPTDQDLYGRLEREFLRAAEVG